ncbi:hypothetical protein [Sutcliffiella halmapala]|uniref:hypothetical protein n=1 Tax=Sutcliffiella halmapala TaxID=79882 RepID=UPI000994C6AF|nr:hypothetical protein [Sutcliffiella halmapala]
MKRIRNIKLFVLLVTLTELIIILRIDHVVYRGVYYTSFFVPILVLQIVLTFGYLNANTRKFFGKAALIIMFAIVPIVFYFYTPNFTFHQAKQLVAQEIDEGAVIVEQTDRYRDNVPIYTEEKRIFLSDRNYHFEVITKDEEKLNFLVHPDTGEVIKMNQAYWP